MGILYFSFISYLQGGILDPQLSSSFLLLDFGSMNSLQGGIPQKFLFNFSSCVPCLPKWTVHVYSTGLWTKSVLVFTSHVTTNRGPSQSYKLDKALIMRLQRATYYGSWARGHVFLPPKWWGRENHMTCIWDRKLTRSQTKHVLIEKKTFK